jgi:hypothetical protein
MRHRELTTPEWERRLEQLIADRYYKQLAASGALQNAIRQGTEAGRSRYITGLMPGRDARQRMSSQRQQREAERQLRAQQRLASISS